MKLSQFRMSISVRLALIQILTAFSILVLFLIVLFGSGFRPFKDGRIENVMMLTRFAMNNCTTKNGVPDSLAIPAVLSSLLSAQPKFLAVEIQWNGQVFEQGKNEELAKARSSGYFTRSTSSFFSGNRLYVSYSGQGQGAVYQVSVVVDSTDIEQRKTNLLVTFSGLFLLSTLCAVFIASPLRLGISRRINELVMKMADIEDLRDFSKDVAVTGNDELSLLTEGFNRMMVQIKQNEKTKDEFIGIASHELKTPLTSIKGYLHLFLESSGDSSENGLIKNIEKNVTKLEDLIRDLSEVSRILSGTFTCESEPLDLGMLVRKTLATIQLANQVRRITVTIPDRATPVSGDDARLAQVISKLVSNAIKFSPASADINITCAFSGQAISVSVRDYGKGIPQGDEQRVFQRFYRPENANPHISGFGVGLFISKAIIECHKGQLGVIRESVGSTFYFIIPARHL
ncbi:MAG: HAMP domain-containing histidine kinase [Chitinophagaceae bacterium]|nr:MAG: HAMP domain-containing histidine kinase [Chitinophagaceae bacterium]